MGKTIIHVAITMADDEFDRLDKRAESSQHTLSFLSEAVHDGLWNEIGVICKATVTKIE